MKNLLDSLDEKARSFAELGVNSHHKIPRKLLGTRIDDAIAAWCRARDIRTDPYRVFRFAGPERGPTQHEAIGPSLPFVRRAFERRLSPCRKCRIAVPP